MPEHEMHKLYEKIGRIEGVQQEMLGEMRRGFVDIKEAVKGHEGKINELERYRDEQEGARKRTMQNASVFGAVTGGFVAGIFWIINKINGQ